MMRLALAVGASFLIGCAMPAPAPVAPPSRSVVAAAVPKELLVDHGKASPAAQATALIGILATAVGHAMAQLSALPDQPAYYLAYEATDHDAVIIRASNGALAGSDRARRRVLDVDLRVGSRLLDNTHPRVDAQTYAGTTDLPLQDDSPAVERALWHATNEAYERAREEYARVQAQRQVGALQEEVADFSVEQPQVSFEPPVALEIDQAFWEQKVRAWSALFRQHPKFERSFVQLQASATNRWFVSSEGSRLQTARLHARIVFGAALTAPDGSPIAKFDEIDVHGLPSLPPESVVAGRIQTLISDLEALSHAPRAEPFVGPAILEGKAAAVFFHEVFGHRVEGHRQRGEAEGRTFTDLVGRRIMNADFDVVDDPTIASINGQFLNGHYRFDSEGMPAQPARLIDQGVFRGFLMSRLPVEGFVHSNGHGRRQPGYRPVARQANLLINPRRVVSRRDLTTALLEEVRRQNKPYGLIIGEVAGGYTTTQRGNPQAFVVEPVMVYRLYPDGRKELVRGVDLEGMPLSVLAGVMAASNDFAVFNGYCGAESGEVPVAAVSPSLLVRHIELTRQQNPNERPPLLPAPPLNESAGSHRGDAP